MVETEDWPNINLVVESREVKIDREISKNEVVEELIVALGKDDRIAWSWTLGPPVRVTNPCALTQRDELVDELVEVVDGRISRPNPNPKRKRRDRYRELAVVWTGHMVRNNTSFGKDFIISWEDEDREGFEESGQG
ncbi:hypothetical protein F2Q70_00020460 [Brassica cretica]|uniref:Uncharacterized protein n=1 Tax=Brassica cretica TaxID=69181 RepID=A0A8S9GNP3_BRACR|nr:hypothetical protein F2Q70_00020460 [Brassica cretica]